MLTLSIRLCKAEGIQQMKSVDILPRLIELLDYQEHTIKSGAMKLLPKFGSSLEVR